MRDLSFSVSYVDARFPLLYHTTSKGVGVDVAVNRGLSSLGSQSPCRPMSPLFFPGLHSAHAHFLTLQSHRAVNIDVCLFVTNELLISSHYSVRIVPSSSSYLSSPVRSQQRSRIGGHLPVYVLSPPLSPSLLFLAFLPLPASFIFFIMRLGSLGLSVVHRIHLMVRRLPVIFDLLPLPVNHDSPPGLFHPGFTLHDCLFPWHIQLHVVDTTSTDFLVVAQSPQSTRALVLRQ